QDLVGFVDLLEPLSGLGSLGGGLEVGMVLARELTVRALDVVSARRARHAQHLVVVAELHRHESDASRGAATTTWAGRSSSSPSRQPRRTSWTMIPGLTLPDGMVATPS